MALMAPRKKPFVSHMGEVPPPRPGWGSEKLEERSPDGHRKDILATLGSAGLVVLGTLGIAWLLYSQLGS